LDEVLLPRVDYGRSRGSFICNISLLTNSHHSLLRLGDVTRSIFSGNMGNQYPLQMLDISAVPEWIRSVKNLQIPVISRHSNDQILNIFDSLKSRINLKGKVLMGAYVTPKELSLIAGLPQEEVVGIELKEQVTFGLNPLEMMPGETISSRVDIIKASFLASFDMEAAIPQVLEAAVYRCYEKMGWDINTSKHPLYPDPFAPGCYPFPMLRDLLEASEQVVKEQGFDERLRQDYIGSIKARLQGLLVGAKGRIFNTLRSIDFSELIRRPVVIELEEIRNGAEKSLLIAFIMTNVIQVLKNEHRKNPNFRHLTLIEEAHHLLTKADPSMSSNRRQAVEMFSDMLAEVRKYGEGLIIVDQIPNKLTSEVLKNTNTKIVHKLFAEDDKVAIGNTMALEPLQQQHLSRLETGQAVIFSQGWKSAVLTQIEQ